MLVGKTKTNLLIPVVERIIIPGARETASPTQCIKNDSEKIAKRRSKGDYSRTINNTQVSWVTDAGHEAQSMETNTSGSLRRTVPHTSGLNSIIGVKSKEPPPENPWSGPIERQRQRVEMNKDATAAAQNTPEATKARDNLEHAVTLHDKLLRHEQIYLVTLKVAPPTPQTTEAVQSTGSSAEVKEQNGSRSSAKQSSHHGSDPTFSPPLEGDLYRRLLNWPSDSANESRESSIAPSE
ncbi:MAG: hypothetical protein Q9169_007100 [Polycauliona sp. 2 TL-2023]